MTGRAWSIAIGLLVLAGCTHPVRQMVDQTICDRSLLNLDAPNDRAEFKARLDEPGLILVSAQEPKPITTLEMRLRVPNMVPGSEAPPIKWFDPKAPDNVKKAIIDKYLPPVPKLPSDPDFPPGPEGRPLTLSDLQKIAVAHSPLLRQAASDVQGARGAALQAGMYPNPTIGYESQSNGPGGGPLAGVFLAQTIKTMGKIKLAQSAAIMDLRVAEYAYRRAETDLMTNVRANYYAVLVAQESIKANRGLVELTDEVYRVMVDNIKGGEVAIYAPLQLSVFSGQARTALVTARNSRLLAWRQLAAVLGVPDMPATAVAGNINRPAPKLDFAKALAHVLTKHTDVLATAPAIEKARHNLRLAQVTPYPDVSVQAALLNDTTPPGPSRLVAMFQIGVPVPIFDRNQGGILQSQAALMRANEEPHRVQADLTARFSEAFRRYDENRVLLEMYHKDILPKQVQAFRAAVKRHFGEGGAGAIGLNDLVSTEQLLVQVIGNYLPVLQAQWQALVDVSNFLQTDQLYLSADEVNSAPGVDFEELLKLPCHHPCGPIMPTPTRESFGKAPVASPLSQAAPVGAPSLLAPVARDAGAGRGY